MLKKHEAEMLLDDDPSYWGILALLLDQDDFERIVAHAVSFASEVPLEDLTPGMVLQEVMRELQVMKGEKC